MRALLVAGLVVSLAAWGAGADQFGHPPFPVPPAEAIQFDAPRALVDFEADGGARLVWVSDGGVCLTPSGIDKVDNRLKQFEAREKATVDKSSQFFWGGMAAGGVLTTIAAGVIAFFVIKH